MQFDTNTPRKARTIAGLLVSVIQPYAAGHALTEGEAQMLNQVLAENFSNNLRAKAEVTEGEGEAKTTRKLTVEEFQPIVDKYMGEYVPGVRQSGGGGGTAKLTPVEREVRNIAKEKLDGLLSERGLKKKEVEYDELLGQIISDNQDALTAQAEKIIKAREQAISKGGDLNIGGALGKLPGLADAEGEAAGDKAEG